MKLSVLTLIAMTIISTAHSVEIIGHRGASYDAPENTVASFKLGWEQQADADELDIYLSKDGQVVVMHDASTKRTAGLDRKIVDQTLEELKTLDAGSWKGPYWKGERIPTLAEALATMPDGKRFFIEIKTGPEILPALEKVLKESGKRPEQLVIIGFGYEAVRQAKVLFPQLQTYWLVSPKKGSEGQQPALSEMIAQAKAAHLDGLDLNSGFPIDEAFVKTIKDAGLKLYTWTVDDPQLAKAEVAAGVAGITTNRPKWMREQLEGAKAAGQ